MYYQQQQSSTRRDSTKTVSGKPGAVHVGAKKLLLSRLAIEDGHSISQKLKWNAGLESSSGVVGDTSVMPQTIHAVKGSEYPAVCVVTTRSSRAFWISWRRGNGRTSLKKRVSCMWLHLGGKAAGFCGAQ